MANLTQIRGILISKKVIITFTILLVLLVFIIPILLTQSTKITEEDFPLPVKEQPVQDGKFDDKAPISQKSKAAIESLKPYLIYRETFTTTSEQKVTFAVFTKPLDEYTLFVEIIGINFQSNHDDPLLARNVQSFRETAEKILAFIKKHDVNPQDIFISWGGQAYVQKSADVWLNVSEEYPKVIKAGDQWEFEKTTL